MAIVVKKEVDKIELDDLKLSFHVRKERNFRLKKIQAYGIGDIIHTFLVDHDGNDALMTLTDNGNIIVTDKNAAIVITLYTMRAREVRNKFYNGNIPEELYNKIKEYNKKVGIR